MPDRSDLLRSAQRARPGPARRGAGGAQPGCPSQLSQYGLRGGISGVRAAHRLPVQLHLRRIDGQDPQSDVLATRAGRGPGGAGRICRAERGAGHALPHHRDPPLLGTQPALSHHDRRAPVLQLHGRGGAIGRVPLCLSGGEPLAAPHARNPAADREPDAALDPLAIQRAYDEGLKRAQAGGLVQPGDVGAPLGTARALPAPRYSQDVQNRGGEALYRGDALPTAPQDVRPEYRDSGRWIAQPGA